MIPILYTSEEKQFNTNGIGFLTDAISCKVRTALNGEYELTLQYPVKGIHFQDIQHRSLILAMADPKSRLQPFRVYRITKPLNGVVTVYARHISYDLAGITVSPFSAQGPLAALEGLKRNSRTDNPFSFYTDKGGTAAFTVDVPKAARSLLGGTEGSVLDLYGGEYEFDRFDVKLLARRGTDNGVSIRYGKNLTDLEQDENCANVYTGVDPYWKNASTGEAVYLDAPVLAAGNYNYEKILPLDMTSKFKEIPTPEQLTAAAEQYIKDNKIGEPKVSWTVSFVQLEQTAEYKGKAFLEQIGMGDTVSVIFSEIGVDASARAVQTDFDSLAERYDSVTLGSVKSSLASTIASQGKDIQNTPSKSGMQAVLEQMASTIMGARGGAVRHLDDDGDGFPDTLYIADNADPSLAKKVWRFNYLGWGASENGYNGPFVMGATFEFGMLADFIRAGVLQSIDGKIRIDLNGGESGPIFNTGISTNGLTVRGDGVGAGAVFTARAVAYQKGDGASGKTFAVGFNSTNGTNLGGFSESWADATMQEPTGINLQLNSQDKRQKIVLGAGNVADVDLYSEGALVGRFWASEGKSTLVASTINSGKYGLYHGSISVGGSAEVPRTSDFDLFAVRLGDDEASFDTVVLAYKTGNVIRGVGGWAGTETEYKELLFLSAEIDEERWIIQDAGVHSVYSGGGMGAGRRLAVKEIRGVI